MKVIEIIVSPKGETRLQTKGFAGSECLDASRLMEAALGTTQHEQLTAESHTSQSAGQQIRQQS